MAEYLAQRIIDGVFSYEYVVSKKPEYKDGIDEYLIKKCKDILIVS